MKKELKMRAIHLTVALILTAALAVSLGVFWERQNGYAAEIGALYDAAYYSAVDNLGDIENKLKKLEVASSTALQRELLEGVYTSAEVTVGHLATLSGKNDEIEPALKFVNQLGDYAYYLGRKADAEGLSDEEKEKLKELSVIVTELNDAFLSAGEEVASGGNIYDALGDGVTALNGIHDLIGANNVEYPELIYDGPFSDGLSDRETKFLDGKEAVSAEKAAEIAESKFGGEFEYAGESTFGIDTYLFVSGDRSVQITQTGGIVAQYTDASLPAGGETKKTDEILASATEFLRSLGYDSMKAVWISEQSDTVYLNFAYTTDDVVYYPDLVKVKVARDTAAVLGMEAMNYIYNHTERGELVFGETDGFVLPEGFERKSLVKCLIPTDWNTERAAYEISGEYDGGTYYVYFDAATGEEIKIMRVIKDGNEGNLIV